MVTVILRLLLHTGGDLEMQPMFNCRAPGSERLSHIQTNGSTEPFLVHFLIVRMEFIGGRVAEMERSSTIHPMASCWVHGHSGCCARRERVNGACPQHAVIASSVTLLGGNFQETERSLVLSMNQAHIMLKKIHF